MSVKQFKTSLERVNDILSNKSTSKYVRVEDQLKMPLKTIEDLVWKVAFDIDDKELRLELITLFDSMKKENEKLKYIREMLNVVKEIKQKEVKFSLTKIPDDVKNDVLADLNELERCYDAGCYRSCIILCGRLLEVGLHRKYFEATGNDLLEKSPGIGLGNLIAKLNEKGILVDPGVMQQVHLVNNVRIFSVHKKKESFVTSKNQTSAIILFTLDTLEKLF
ncbi:hypothetical protein J4467_03875 [Candidatus Woesearchaeota archaeon]|nr:hypothetical protein [Candidatus Woesearchaeota archaeon]